jgi:hypothetical protein
VPRRAVASARRCVVEFPATLTKPPEAPEGETAGGHVRQVDDEYVRRLCLQGLIGGEVHVDVTDGGDVLVEPYGPSVTNVLRAFTWLESFKDDVLGLEEHRQRPAAGRVIIATSRHQHAETEQRTPLP